MTTLTTDHISEETRSRLKAAGVVMPQPIPEDIRELHRLACYFASVGMPHESGVCAIEIARLWRERRGSHG